MNAVRMCAYVYVLWLNFENIRKKLERTSKERTESEESGREP